MKWRETLKCREKEGMVRRGLETSNNCHLHTGDLVGPAAAQGPKIFKRIEISKA